MDNKYCSKILESSNLYTSKFFSDFVVKYTEKLVYDIYMYVDNNIGLGKIIKLDSLCGKHELSQKITGAVFVTSGIDGQDNILLEFARQYSRIAIESYDILAREAVLDFLNLHNGLFAVMQSKMNIYELSLNPPKQNGNYAFDLSEYKSITIIPVIFTYGTIKFYLCEA